MKRFLAAAFHFTLLEVVLVLGFSLLKVLLTSTGWDDRLRMPLVFTGMGAFLFLLASYGIAGYLENAGYTVERWVADRPQSWLRTWTSRFVYWGRILPVAFGNALFFYLIAPTSLLLFIALFAGIVLRNSIRYTTKKKEEEGQASEFPPKKI